MKDNRKHRASAAETPEADEKKTAKNAAAPEAETKGSAAAAAAENAAAPEADAAAEAKPEPSELEKTQRALAEMGEKYIYLQAEYQNYRKRVSKELAGVRSATLADTLAPFLTVYDFLNMADVAAATSDNIESIRQGLKMIIGEFTKAFDELGVKSLSAAGEKFDPALHEAVASENSDTVPEGVVIRQWSSGFKLGETLLRPARVVVSAGPAQPEAEKETEQESPGAAETEEK